VAGRNHRLPARQGVPGYLRGRSGTVERVFEGSYRYFRSTGPDGLGEPMAVYIVRFDPALVWGTAAEPTGGRLYAELYETYLTPFDQEGQP
jgi:nitrile hydratase subunit beta